MRKILLILLVTLTATPAISAPVDRIASVSYVNKITETLNGKVDLGSKQTITGEKTFLVSPVVPTPPLPQSL